MPPIFTIWIAEIGGFLACFLSGSYTDGLHALAVAPMVVLVARSSKWLSEKPKLSQQLAIGGIASCLWSLTLTTQTANYRCRSLLVSALVTWCQLVIHTFALDQLDACCDVKAVAATPIAVAQHATVIQPIET